MSDFSHTCSSHTRDSKTKTSGSAVKIILYGFRVTELIGHIMSGTVKPAKETRQGGCVAHCLL